jgi:hypothetical protein
MVPLGAEAPDGPGTVVAGTLVIGSVVAVPAASLEVRG